jgi:hypothetical protein
MEKYLTQLNWHLDFGHAARALAWSTARIEAAAPFPGVLIMRVAGADCDRADVHVTVVDVPAFLEDFRIAAAGERGHAPLKRGPNAPAIAQNVELRRSGPYCTSYWPIGRRRAVNSCAASGY